MDPLYSIIHHMYLVQRLKRLLSSVDEAPADAHRFLDNNLCYRIWGGSSDWPIADEYIAHTTSSGS